MQTSWQALNHLKQGSRPVIGCLPLYPPLELFHSLGLAPVVLWGLRDVVPRVPDADRHVQNYVCSVGRRLTQFVINEGRDILDGLFFYNAGDTLRNLPEIIRQGRIEAGGRDLPMFRMHLPMTSPAQVGVPGYFKNEIEELIVSLENHYGVTFSQEVFAESVKLYDRMRNGCRQLETAVADGRLSFVDFCQMLTEANFLEVSQQVELIESRLAGLASPPARRDEPIRLIVSGILPPPPAICEMMEQSGLMVAGNDIASLRRSYAVNPSRKRTVTDFYRDFYRDHFPCTTLLYTADRRFEAIMDLVAKTKARGFIFIGEKFCEYEYFEWPHLEQRLKEAGLAVLSLEISLDEENAGLESVRTRLEAFTEIVNSLAS
ncbi:MAG: 2-hydroxyacyl-CoA dehydratase subunit D [Desulfosudaceae bacterium]